MGFLTCGFTSSTHSCFLGWIIMCLEGGSSICAMYGYVFILFYCVTGAPAFYTQYFCVIVAMVHLCVFIFLVLHDFYFKSDMMFFTGQSESVSNGLTTTTTFGSFETNSIEQEESSCFQNNPMVLYRKHYVVTSIKIIFVILDIVVLIIFSDGWKCADRSFKC